MQIIVVALSKPWLGRLSDHYGRVKMIVTGLVLGGIVTALITRTTSYPLLVVLIGLFGLGLATVTASTAALVADLSRAASYGGAFGVLSAIMDIGHSSGPMAGGLLVAAYSYDGAFTLVGAGLVVAGVLFMMLMSILRHRWTDSQPVN